MNLTEHDRAMLHGAAREIRALHRLLFKDCPGGCPAEDYAAKLDALANRREDSTRILVGIESPADRDLHDPWS